MWIKYIGKSQRRIVGPFEWNQENGFAQYVVDASLALELVTSPFNEFVAVEVQEEEKLEEFITGTSVVPMKKKRTLRKKKIS